jgi:hypothetical protein
VGRACAGPGPGQWAAGRGARRARGGVRVGVGLANGRAGMGGQWERGFYDRARAGQWARGAWMWAGGAVWGGALAGSFGAGALAGSFSGVPAAPNTSGGLRGHLAGCRSHQIARAACAVCGCVCGGVRAGTPRRRAGTGVLATLVGVVGVVW